MQCSMIIFKVSFLLTFYQEWVSFCKLTSVALHVFIHHNGGEHVMLAALQTVNHNESLLAVMIY